EHGGMAVSHARDEAADAHVLGERSVRGEELPTLEVRPMRVAVDRVEVVPDPEGIEPQPVGLKRALAERSPGGVLGPEVDAEMHGVTHYRASTKVVTAPGADPARLTGRPA